jgi:hypothetical protein
VRNTDLVEPLSERRVLCAQKKMWEIPTQLDPLEGQNNLFP